MNKTNKHSVNENQPNAQIIEALSQKLVAINKAIAKELATMEELQDEMAFVAAKVQGKVDDRKEIAQSLAGYIVTREQGMGHNAFSRRSNNSPHCHSE